MKISINLIAHGVTLAICTIVAVAFFLTSTLIGYVVGAVFFVFSLFEVYFFCLKLWLYNGGKPLSEAQIKKREQYSRQMRDYQRYNLYNRWYRFGDEAEAEYQAEKAKEELKKTQ